MFDGKAFGQEVVSIVRDYVDRKTAPLLEQIEALRIQVTELRERRATLAYRGVHVDGEEYQLGDFVTAQGSVWHCNRTTKTRPEGGSANWTLAVKRGADGKDAR